MLNQRTYFAKKNAYTYMGASQFKAFRECEAKAMSEINGIYVREETTALIQGKYFDAYFENKLKVFCKKNYEQIFKKSGEKYAYIQDVDKVIAKVQKDPEYMRLASGTQQTIMTGVIQGVPVKIMIDSLLPHESIIDRKLMAGFSDIWKNGEKVPWWKAWGYDIQAAMYQYIYEQNTGDLLPFRLAAATKEKVTDLKVCEFSENTIQNALGEIMANIEIYQAIKQGKKKPSACGECIWCRQGKKIIRGEYEII